VFVNGVVVTLTPTDGNAAEANSGPISAASSPKAASMQTTAARAKFDFTALSSAELRIGPWRRYPQRPTTSKQTYAIRMRSRRLAWRAAQTTA
jgi:hypothetical protein